MADVWTALVTGLLGFVHSRAGDLTGGAFSDSVTFIGTLANDLSITQQVKDALKQLKADVAALKDEVKPVKQAIDPQIAKSKEAVKAMAAELATSPFTLGAAGRAASALADLLTAVDEALSVVANKVAHMDDADPGKRLPDVRDAIVGIREPWVAPFRGLAAGSAQLFDDVVNQLVGVGGASGQLADALEYVRAEKRFDVVLVATGGDRTPAPAFPAFKLGDVQLVAFFQFKEKATLGLRVRSILKAGLRSDGLVQKLIPAGAPSADTKPTVVTLDTTNGLTFGDGESQRLVLPVRFAYPAVELRELAISRPVGPDGSSNEIDLTATVAAKLGDVVGMVVEGCGVAITRPEPPAAGAPFAISGRLPDGAGARIQAGPVSGGGFIVRKGTEYGAMLDLKLFTYQLTAFGLLNTNPFSLVVVLTVQFTPPFQLGFGFTVGGLGGLLALERGVSTDELRKGVREGTAEQLLFPANAVDAAPGILDRVQKVFPAQAGGFAIGLLAKLGWGSVDGFVTAKVGIILALPDPKLIVLGALQVQFPPSITEATPSIVDLHAELYGEFTPEYLLILAGLNGSKIAGISISGDVGLLVRWAGGADFALSVGGFYPNYEPPRELTGLRRMELDLSTPKYDILKITATAYLAVTTNSVQFGGSVRVKADLTIASGEAWLTVDAIFHWAPRFAFEVVLTAGITLKAFGETFAGVSFTGLLRGATPWYLEGTATVDVWWLPTIDYDLGPFEWGEIAQPALQAVSPLQAVKAALELDAAWAPVLPEGAGAVVRLVSELDPVLLVNPLGVLEVKQSAVPLETTIDRIGQNPVTAHRVNLSAPLFGVGAAGVVSPVQGLFAIGNFLNLSDDQAATRPHFEEAPSGMRLAASAAPVSGSPAVKPYQWETVFPRETFPPERHPPSLGGLTSLVLRTSSVARAGRERVNGYLSNKEAVRLRPHGEMVLRRRDDLSPVGNIAERMTSTAAAELRTSLGDRDGVELQLVAAGVAA